MNKKPGEIIYTQIAEESDVLEWCVFILLTIAVPFLFCNTVKFFVEYDRAHYSYQEHWSNTIHAPVRFAGKYKFTRKAGEVRKKSKEAWRKLEVHNAVNRGIYYSIFPDSTLDRILNEIEDSKNEN